MNKSCINPDYHPDTAHLPSEQDMKRWRGGEREECQRKLEALKRFKARWEKMQTIREHYEP